MPYVLKNIEDGKYVTRPGSNHSYTFWITQARVFSSKEDAENNSCGNERIIEVSESLHGDN